MSESVRRQAGTVSFWLAVFIWLLAIFPCVHLQQLYMRQHVLSPTGAGPELFTAYLRRAVWAAAALSLLGPALLWLLPARFKKEAAVVLFCGGAIGLASGVALWTVMAQAFQWVSNKPLGAETFLYSGLLAGIVAGEIHRRGLSARSGLVRSAAELKRDFHVASLMIWALVLKGVECRYSITVEPGRAVAGIHFAMFLSILLWSPWVCRYFWKRKPESLLSSVIRSAVAGVLSPPLSAAVLYLPVVMLILTGTRGASSMLWGGEILLSPYPWWLRILIAFPGLIWGVLVGGLRWRYLGLENQISLAGPRE